MPSAYNSQPIRIVLLFGEDHPELWSSIIKDALKAIVSEKVFTTSEKKIDSFSAAFGTALFFNDHATTLEQEERNPRYTGMFSDRAEQSAGMHQFALWTALCAEGLGANLQHYNPIVDDQIREAWSIPESWQLRAQLVFEGIQGGPYDKKYNDIDGERLFIHGAASQLA